MLKNHSWIQQQALSTGFITPFCPDTIRQIDNVSAISFGLGSYSYDLRLSPSEFAVFCHIPGTVVDPKRFNKDNLKTVKLQDSNEGQYFALPAHSYGLGVSLEKIVMPEDAIAICLSKSTYARTGVIVNTTVVQAGWRGHLVLELSNSSSADVRIYANEGIAQLVFLKGEPAKSVYSNSHYQNQQEKITTPRV